MVKKILIAYGSRYGATKEVSQEIAKIIEDGGLEVQLLDLVKIKPKQSPAISEFDGVLIGSGIKMSKWVKQARTFLEKNKREFEKKNLVLGIFISSGLAINPDSQLKAKEDYIMKIIDKLGVQADVYDAFPGVLDLSEEANMGFLDKKMIKLAAMGMAAELGFDYEPDKKNDFRDWDKIRSFARQFVDLVKN